jgi:hypothetical protein
MGPWVQDSFRGVAGLGACFVSVVSLQISVRADERAGLSPCWRNGERPPRGRGDGATRFRFPKPRPSTGSVCAGSVLTAAACSGRSAWPCSRRSGSGEDPAPLSAGELFRRTLRADGADRADHRMLIFSEQHFRRVLGAYAVHYNTQRPHRRCNYFRHARKRRSPSRSTAGSDVDRFSAVSSTITNPRPETARQAP